MRDFQEHMNHEPVRLTHIDRMHSVQAVERAIPQCSMARIKAISHQAPSLLHGPYTRLSPFETEPQPAERTSYHIYGGEDKKRSHAHPSRWKEPTIQTGKSIDGSVQTLNADPSWTLLFTRLASFPEIRLPPSLMNFNY
ncbi:hypothetical protein Bca101_081021 [Brassica carinata]